MNLRKKILSCFLSVVLMFSLSGCIYLVIGGVGVLGGYVVSPDTFEGILTDQEQEDVWQTAIDVVSVMGIISEQSEPGGIIVAKIQNAKVQVNIFQMSKSTVRLTVKARKTFFPKIKIAQEVYVKIVNELASN